ncbi:hypothetical protein [Streptomyces sp. B21-083]
MPSTRAHPDRAGTSIAFAGERQLADNDEFAVTTITIDDAS